MAKREITIPFGPDKTGGLGFGMLAEDAETETDEIQDATEEIYDPFEPRPVEAVSENSFYDPNQPDAYPSFDAYIPPTPEAMEQAYEDEYPELPVIAPGQGYPTVAPEVPNPQARMQRAPLDVALPEIADPEYVEQYAEDAEERLTHDDVSMSFAALKDSFGQSRELKAREKDMEEFRAQVKIAREELDDRENILKNYALIVAEQQTIVDQCTQQREASKAELAQVVTEREHTSAELEQMSTYYDEQMQPLQSELGRVSVNLDQAKNDERSRKSELTAVEAELRRAQSTSDAPMIQAKYDIIKQAYEKASATTTEAQDAMNEVQRIYDEAVNQIEQAEGPLRRAIEDLEQREAHLKEVINQLGDDISTARKRLQYCEAVYQYPEETDKMRASVKTDEEELYEMKLEYDELNELLAESKAKSRKAKVALGLGIAIVVIFIIILVVIFTRG